MSLLLLKQVQGMSKILFWVAFGENQKNPG